MILKSLDNNSINNITILQALLIYFIKKKLIINYLTFLHLFFDNLNFWVNNSNKTSTKDSSLIQNEIKLFWAISMLCL